MLILSRRHRNLARVVTMAQAATPVIDGNLRNIPLLPRPVVNLTFSI